MSVITVGDAAPPIELNTQTGVPWRLADARGRRSIVLTFFPFAFSKT